MASENQTIYRVYGYRGARFLEKRHLYVIFSINFFKACGMVTFHSNFLKLAKTPNSNMLFNLTDHLFAIG